MKNMICKRCGAQIDLALGECPVCGAIYYVINEKEDGLAQPPDPAADELDQTRPFRTQEAPPRRTPPPAAKPAQPRPAPPRPERPLPPAPTRQGERRRKKRMAAGFAVAALALLAVLTVLLCVIGGVFDFAAREADQMPYVVGQTEANARAMLEELDLRVETTISDSPEAAGVVIAQSIPADRTLKGNETVTLTVSNGSQAQPVDPGEAPVETVEAPYVLGESYDSARTRVEGMGLYLIRYGEEFSDRPEGTILRQEPAGGTPVQPGSAVNVTVSKGPEPVTYTISVTAGKGGEVSPKGQVTVEEGGQAAFTILPDAGYEIREVKIDGQDVGPVESYVFEDVQADHSIYAVFQAVPEATEPPAETDAPTPPPDSPAPGPETTDAPVTGPNAGETGQPPETPAP